MTRTLITDAQLHEIEHRCAQLRATHPPGEDDGQVAAVCEDVYQLLYELGTMRARFREATIALAGHRPSPEMDAILERNRISGGGR